MRLTCGTEAAVKTSYLEVLIDKIGPRLRPRQEVQHEEVPWKVHVPVPPEEWPAGKVVDRCVRPRRESASSQFGPFQQRSIDTIAKALKETQAHEEAWKERLRPSVNKHADQQQQGQAAQPVTS